MLSPQSRHMLLDQAAHWGVALDKRQLDQISQFYDLLIEANQRFNLTRITDEHEVVVKHFLDSLTVLTALEGIGPLRLVDVGTGAGFPAIPLLIARPDWKGLLVDSVGKKVRFLEETVRALGLEAVAVHGRAEDIGQNPVYREQFDLAVARAVGPLSPLAEYCLPLITVGGLFVAMRGRDREDAGTALSKLGGDVMAVKELELEGMQRHLVVIRKARPTPKTYPRRPGQPTDKPL